MPWEEPGAPSAAPDHAIVTLTYPCDWVGVAGKSTHVLAHMGRLSELMISSWGDIRFIQWAMELMRSGAPAVHIRMCIPPGRSALGAMAPDKEFREWIAETWSFIVARPDDKQHLRAGTAIHRDPTNLQKTMTELHRLAEESLIQYAAIERDSLVRIAYAAGLSKNRIHEVSRIARTTIDRILTPKPSEKG